MSPIHSKHITELLHNMSYQEYKINKFSVHQAVSLNNFIYSKFLYMRAVFLYNRLSGGRD